MKRLVFCVAALSVATALSGCQSVLTDLQTCERHYNGTVAGGSLTPAVLAGAAKIDCCPAGTYGVDSGTVSAHCVPLPTQQATAVPAAPLDPGRTTP